MTARPLILLVLLAVAGLAGCQPDVPPPDTAPSLVLITLDTLRADRLGSYGYGRGVSPVLDALAAQSVRFDNAIAQSAVTPVSHASILTGLNPYRHGLRSLHGGQGYALAENHLTLAELMRANGRRTAGFVSAFPASRHFGLNRGFEVWDEDFPDEETLTERGIVNTGRAQRRGDETTDRALAWLGGVGDAPFFLWIHYFDVHDPLLLPPTSTLAKFPPRSSSERDRKLATYDAEVFFVDTQIGRVLRALDREGIRDNTVIAVVADHGEGLGDHGWWGHSILYQEQIRVPFILCVPRRGWSGRVDTLVRTVDLFPTLVDVMELACPGGPCESDGETLSGLIEGSPGDARIAYSESVNDLAAYYDSPLRDDSLYSIQDGRFKLLARYDGATRKPSMLFDLSEDPAETENLIDERPGVEARLRAILDGLDAIAEKQPMSPLDEATRERLRSLGYVR